MIVFNKINNVVLSEVKNLFLIFYNKSFKSMYSFLDKSLNPGIKIYVNKLCPVSLYYIILYYTILYYTDMPFIIKTSTLDVIINSLSNSKFRFRLTCGKEK
jgi:hypothetical protein